MKSRISRNFPKEFSIADGPLFYYVTDRRQLTGMSLEASIRRALEWGVDFIQVREKDLSDRILFEQVRRVVALARGTNCRILVNGRADIAVAAGADGVHLPSAGLRIADIRRWIPEDFLIGASVHSEEEMECASNDGADYALLGHIFPTASKSGMGKPVGLEFLEKACASYSIPIFALGGIDAGRIASVLSTGAAGIAGISLFQKETGLEELEQIIKTSKKRSRP